MKKNYYRLFANGYYTVATYCGTKSNANAYFRRWISRNVPETAEHPFKVHAYGNYLDFVQEVNFISSTIL